MSPPERVLALHDRSCSGLIEEIKHYLKEHSKVVGNKWSEQGRLGFRAEGERAAAAVHKLKLHMPYGTLLVFVPWSIDLLTNQRAVIYVIFALLPSRRGICCGVLVA